MKSEWTPGIRKVLRHVKGTKGWGLEGGYGLIRTEGGRGMCPLRSMTGTEEYLLDAVEVHGLTNEEAWLVMDAADDHPGALVQRIRTSLLKAARLA